MNSSRARIQAKIIGDCDKFYDPDKDKINLDLMATLLKREHHINLAHNKLYRLKAQIKYDHPELFETSEEPNNKKNEQSEP